MAETFDIRKQCCFCGANNEHEVRGYAGERECRSCGHGGDGEPDLPVMFYKTATVVAPPTESGHE
jgi:hypothetical protein